MISTLTFKRSGSVCCVAVCALLAMIYPATGVPIDRVADHATTVDPSSPPLKKGGQGGFFIADFRSSDQGKSPSVSLLQREKQSQPQLRDSLQSRDMSAMRSMCVEVVSDAGVQRSQPIRLGSTLRLSFRHSIYGSRVEEVFRLRPDGFHLTELRYAERRLVEFYGYEDAKSENGTWVVRPRPAVIPSLSLRTSLDASLSLFLDLKKKSIQLAMPADSALHLTIAHCKDAHNG